MKSCLYYPPKCTFPLNGKYYNFRVVDCVGKEGLAYTKRRLTAMDFFIRNSVHRITIPVVYLSSTKLADRLIASYIGYIAMFEELEWEEVDSLA